MGGAGACSDELREKVERMREQLDGDERRLRHRLGGFYWLRRLPFAVSLMVLVWLYWQLLGSVVQ